MKTRAEMEQGGIEKRRAPSALEQWKHEVNHEKTLSNLARALQGTGFTPERFAYTAYMVGSRNERLLAADRKQLWMGVYAAAECGLSLQPHVQQMHLVPYGKDITPIIGYQGFSYLVAKAGRGLMSPPVYVFQRDIDEGRFHYREGSREICDLDPIVKNPQAPKGILRFVFCTFTNEAGVVKFKVLDRDTILERRERSAGYQAFKAGRRKTSPWEIQLTKDGSETGDFIAMAGKTVIRDFSKYLPKSTDHWGERAAKAEAVEGTLEGLEKDPTAEALSEVLDTTFQLQQEQTGTERMKEKLGVDEAQIEEEQPKK